jgi:enoyl-[acyl-carrier-protein] reductase (NADH)
MSGKMKNKKGLILGVANGNSISWGVGRNKYKLFPFAIARG